VAFDTMARPGFWHPGQEKDDYDTPAAARRRLRGAVLVAVGALMLIWGFSLINSGPVPALPTHHFNPSAADLAVLRVGGTAVPPSCSEPDLVPDNGLGFTIAPGNADTQFTVYRHSLMTVNGDQDQTPEFSASAPMCQFESAAVGANSSTSYFLERPGRVTVYFIQGSQVSVVRIVVTSSSPPSNSSDTRLGWVLIVLGVLTLIVGVVFWYRRAGDKSPLNYSVMRTSRENESLLDLGAAER